MSEKRKPQYTILLRKQGKKKDKRVKIELFPEHLWKTDKDRPWRKRSIKQFRYGDRFRVRLNGKWFPPNKEKPVFFTKTQIKEMMFRNIGDSWIKHRKEK